MAEAHEGVPFDPASDAGLGTWLRDLRARSAMTQAELAQAAAVSTRNIQRWEANENAPGGYELLRLFHALGVRVHEIPDGAPGAVNAELRAIREMFAAALRRDSEPAPAGSSGDPLEVIAARVAELARGQAVIAAELGIQLGNGEQAEAAEKNRPARTKRRNSS